MKTDSLWYAVYYDDTEDGNSLKRFVTLLEAQEFIKTNYNKTAFEPIGKRTLNYGGGIKIVCCYNAQEYAIWLSKNKTKSKLQTRNFISNKILGIGRDVPINTLIDILKQAEIMEKEIRIMKYTMLSIIVLSFPVLIPRRYCMNGS